MIALRVRRQVIYPADLLSQVDAFFEQNSAFGRRQVPAPHEAEADGGSQELVRQAESEDSSVDVDAVADAQPRPVDASQPMPAPQAPVAVDGASSSAQVAPAKQLVSPLQKMLGDDYDQLDVEVFDIFLEEAEELTEQADEALNAWLAEPTNMDHGLLLKRLVHTFKGGARLAGLRELGDLSHDFETFLEDMPEGEPDEAFLNKTQTQFDQVAQWVAELRKAMAQHEQGELVPLSDFGTAEADTAAAAGLDEMPSTPSVAEPFEPAPQPGSIAKQGADDAKTQAVAPEPLALQQSEPAVLAAEEEPTGDRSGDEEDRGPLDTSQQQDSVRSGSKFAIPVSVREVEDPDAVAAVFLSANGDEAVPLVPVELPYQKETKALEVQPKKREVKEARRGGGESVKVQSNLLEKLINLAGETSIFRGRVENEVSRFHQTIGEMNGTIDRLRDLLRRLDIETEAHILYRHEKDKDGYEEFDPLEMDRYSALNQLSRSLSESASDLTDLTETMGAKVRDAETLLVQQSRVNTELQEGLMRTQLEPFSKMIPRLRRIVRQVSGELGKEVELEVVNAEGELDRHVLDRMVAPLEHMLRNAVDHGLEMPEEREAVGKKRVGRVTLFIAREGGEVVLRLSDDGKGIATEAVREKAISNGLMKPDAVLSDNDIMQFILKPGFSTASKVTQISGRGVGMDVVNSEIKQLGGNMKIHSAAGVGTQFTVRLPFTVSVNRALMVVVGEDRYAIPLSNIEGIVRVSPCELMNYYKPDAPQFGYAGRQYVMEYLGRYVHGKPVPSLEGVSRPLPVLLLRSGESSVALQVDQLLDSREVVVKSLGPQLSTVSGISGATILGDGNVVIILDMLAMLRAGKAGEREILEVEADTAEEVTQETRKTPLVMVVDDSVTVRKVTSRLLERHGLDVVLAKDGMDAINKLHDIRPDIMLLDIEMPRMDGFEVASQVRHSDRLRDLPIIMITSRTGEKHRNRALSLGVNKYMGKPFQETQLLENIQSLLKQEIQL
jgi:chemosensory pili system protein ChpA (sensor histidine kinase/response regulator)